MSFSILPFLISRFSFWLIIPAIHCYSGRKGTDLVHIILACRFCIDAISLRRVHYSAWVGCRPHPGRPFWKYRVPQGISWGPQGSLQGFLVRIPLTLQANIPFLPLLQCFLVSFHNGLFLVESAIYSAFSHSWKPPIGLTKKLWKTFQFLVAKCFVRLYVSPSCISRKTRDSWVVILKFWQEPNGHTFWLCVWLPNVFVKGKSGSWELCSMLFRCINAQLRIHLGCSFS